VSGDGTDSYTGGFLDQDAIAERLTHASAADVEEFWRAVAREGTPLVDATGDRATFLWRMRPGQSSNSAVYVFVNRVTDKANIDLGMLDNVPGTDIWVRTLDIPAARRASYGFRELPPGERPAPGPPPIGRGGLRLDPLNPLPPVTEFEGEYGLSVCRGSTAPDQPHWESEEAHAHEILGTLLETTATLPTKGGTAAKRALLYLPPAPADSSERSSGATGTGRATDSGGAPLGLITMFDAEKWFRAPGLPRALDFAISRGDLPPFAVLAIENLSVADRMATLGTDTAFLDAVAGELVPWAVSTAEACGFSVAPRGAADRIITGESLGGLSSLLAALHLPGEWGTVLAQSPSMWRTPDATGTPLELADTVEPWITGHFRKTPRPAAAPRVRITVGTAEGPSIAMVRELGGVCRAAGWDCTDTVYDGGHDNSCWRGELFALLAGAQLSMEGALR